MRPTVGRWVGLSVVAALLVGCTSAPSRSGATAEGSVHYANPPGSPKRTPIVTRLPTLIGRFIKHGFAPETLDRSHVLEHDAALASLRAAGAANSVTWIGHMTALLRIDGVTILADPWWSDYASPIPRLGPKRYVEPALAIDELPPVDVVVVSHSHYDHLDLKAVSELPGRERTTAVVPLGLGEYFRQRGYGSVVELAWDETVRVQGVDVTALPAIHWSKRTLMKTNDTLWAAFAIEGPSGVRVYFGGDSDYGPVHAAALRHQPGYDLALLSIGGFHNDGVHCAPEECARMGIEIGARALVPMHWGTIYLGEGPPHKLPARFAAAALDSGRSVEDVWVMRIGETRALPPATPRAPPTLLAAEGLE